AKAAGAGTTASGAKPSFVTDTLQARVTARLGAAHIAADVDDTAPHALRVVVDSDSVETADELLQWPGGLSLHAVDETMKLSLPPRARPEEVVRSIADASSHLPRERHWVPRSSVDGSVEAVAVIDPPIVTFANISSATVIRHGHDVTMHVAPAGV